MAPQVGLEPTTTRLTAECSAIELLRNMESGNDLSSRAVTSQVLSARRSLTSVFGMGTGGTFSPLSPETCWIRFVSYPQNLILWNVAAFAAFRSIESDSHSLFRSSPRPISIDNLTHHCVYSVNLSTLSSSRGLTGLCHGILVLEGGFTLRCFQRLSRPHFASLLCRWHDNSCTRGASTPVLSY